MTLSVDLSGNRGAFKMHFEFELPTSGVTVLFGSSGAGKTSLLRAIAGLDRLTGCVRFKDEVWQDSSRRRWLEVPNRGVGMVFQEGELFPHLSVEENLNYAEARARSSRGVIEKGELIETMRLGPLLQSFPGRLSTGQKQRVALSRTLLSRPRILLLDEPLANLDLPAREEILTMLETLRLGSDLPILYVTHSWAEMDRLADRVVRLVCGRVAQIGQPAEIGDGDEGSEPETDLGVLVEAVVAQHLEEERLTELSFAGGRIQMPRRQLGIGKEVRVRFLARDVSLTRQRAVDTSILNIFEGQVVAVRRPDTSQPIIVLDVSGETLLARVTYRSLRALDLAPGVRVWAQIKGVALVP